MLFWNIILPVCDTLWFTKLFVCLNSDDPFNNFVREAIMLFSSPPCDRGNWGPKTSRLWKTMALQKTLWSLTSVHQSPYQSIEGIRSTKHMSDILHIISFSSLPGSFLFPPPTGFPTVSSTCQTPPASGLLSLLVSLPGMSFLQATLRAGSLPYFLPAFSQYSLLCEAFPNQPT